MKTITVKIRLDDKQIAALTRYAKETYAPTLEIDWKTVARGWAEGGLRDHIAALIERQQKRDERMAEMEIG